MRLQETLSLRGLFPFSNYMLTAARAQIIVTSHEVPVGPLEDQFHPRAFEDPRMCLLFRF